MKRFFFTAIMTSALAPAIWAANYDITLSSGAKYSDCQIVYETANRTKFRGKDANGKTVTKEVKSSTILFKREVPEEKPEPKPAPEPKPEETTETTEQTTETPAEGGEEAKPEETTPETPPAAPQQSASDGVETLAKDATLRLREKLAQVDAEFAELTSPTRSLQSRCADVKRRVTAKLPSLDQQAMEVAALQEKYNTAGAQDYTFTIVPPEQRDAYKRDGLAAYHAMLNDMKENKSKRKIAGLDKFEILRERYQGIPEYKQALEKFRGTITRLQKHWQVQLAKEEKRRERLNAAKKADMREKDEEQYDKFGELLKEDGDNMATTWFYPNPRNLKMLQTCVNRAKDALRRLDNTPERDQKLMGTVVTLIEEFWAMMDNARTALVQGDYETAEKILDEDETFRTINSLSPHFLPKDFKDPIQKQHKDFKKAITDRKREMTRMQRELEREISRLERAVSSQDAQLTTLLGEIAAAQAQDTGENTITDAPAKEEKSDEKKDKPAEKEAK